jgi:hypothetical protein
MAGGVIPMVAEAAAEGSSSATGFPARRAVKPGPNSCSRTRGSCWCSRIGRRRGGGEAYRRGGDRRRGSSGGGPAMGSGLGASVK